MNLDAWLVDTITREASTGQNLSGDPTFSGTQTTFMARVQQTKERVQLSDGSGDAWARVLYAVVDVNEKDRLWLPGTNTADPKQARRPVKVEISKNKQSSYTLYKIYVLE